MLWLTILGAILAPIALFLVLMCWAAYTFGPEDEEDWPVNT